MTSCSSRRRISVSLRCWAVLLVIAAFRNLAAAAQAPASLLVDPTSLPPTRSVAVFGQKIVYYDLGSGPTVVLVHGFASQAIFDFGQVIRPLAAHHRVIALDQVGFGQSDKPAIDYSVQTWVDFLGEFLRTLHIDHFTLVGESLGGWITASYTIQALSPQNIGPDALPKPGKLILEDAAGHKGTNGPAPVAGSLADAAGVAVIFYDKSRVTPEFIRQSWAFKMKANDGMTQRLYRANPKVASETVGDKLAAITIPTLVVWGANDAVVPLADGQDYAAKIPHAKLIIVPQCGHVASMERPAEFLAAVVPFLP